MVHPCPRLLVAASGTGGHLFPAIATAEALQQAGYQIEWLGVPDRLETTLVPPHFHRHTVTMTGFQGRWGYGTLRTLVQFAKATLTTRRILQQGKFAAVFTTGGYIAAPAILAARSLGLPAILHEANAMPGKVTRWLGPWCSVVALGFAEAQPYLGKARTRVVGTPVRPEFLTPTLPLLEDPPIPEGVPLILVVGGSQGAVALNQRVRQAAPAWLQSGAWIVHQTGNQDPDRATLAHPHYIHRPFLTTMAALLYRADLVISRAGAGTLTELAVTQTPSLLIPYPFAADDHQTFNARVFSRAGAALLLDQGELSPQALEAQVLTLLDAPPELARMAAAAADLAVKDSADRLTELVRRVVEANSW